MEAPGDHQTFDAPLTAPWPSLRPPAGRVDPLAAGVRHVPPTPDDGRGTAPPDAGQWWWHLVRGTMRRPVEVATYASGVLGILVLWAVGHWGLVAHRPLWLLYGVFAGVAGAGWAADSWYAAHPSPLRLQALNAASAVGVSVVIYLVGWGPALAIGYVIPILTITFYGASPDARWLRVSAAAWPILAMAVSQALVATGTIHLLVRTRPSFGLAAIGALAVVLVAVIASTLAAGKEEAERALAHAASHDPLTGLVNRVVFTDALARTVAACRRHGRPVAVLFCDLLGFKEVNDTRGHEAGDRAIAEVARRFVACTRREDLVARFGGDEFVMALSAEPPEAAAAAERLLRVLQQPIDPDADVRVGCSIGIACCRDGSADVDHLLSVADAAMYEAKGRGRSAYVLRHVP